MSTQTLYIPEKIKVGFQERHGTYTGKLAYVIYYRDKKLRKEKSWQSWRSSNIKPLDCDNEATEGFVLNKGVGGTKHSYSWNPRNEYIRVYDPRDFEFEISVANLLFILKECDCSRGKGLEGKFIYAWDGAGLVLLPIGSEDYKKSAEHTELQHKKVSARDLVKGGTYKTKQGDELIYLGRFERNRCYIPDSYNDEESTNSLKKVAEKQHIFWAGKSFQFLSSMAKLGLCVSDTPVDNYAELVQRYHNSIYGTKVKELFIKNDTKKDDDYRRYNGYETSENGTCVLYRMSGNKTYYMDTYWRVFIKDGTLVYEDYHHVSYPPGYAKPTSYWGRRSTSTSEISWVDRSPHKRLWAKLESGISYEVGYRGLLRSKNG